MNPVAQNGETVSALPLRDIRGPVPIDVLDWRQLAVLGLVLVFLLLLAGLLWRWKTRQRPVAAPSCDLVALERLRRARRLIRDGGDTEFAEIISDILRTYIRDRFHLDPRGQTTREFIGSLAHQRDNQIPRPLADNKTGLETWLDHCDLVKFARSSIPPRIKEEMADNLETFIRATRPRPENGTERRQP